MDDVFLLVSTGQGPRETGLGLALFETPFVETCGRYGVECSWNAQDVQAPRSVLLVLSGEQAHWLAAQFEGVWAWHARSPLRPGHKRRMWCANASIVPAPQGALRLDETRITWRTTRAGGPGGQHQNTTDSAVIASYICPETGQEFVGRSRDGRSQHQNRAKALARLRAAMGVWEQAQEGDRSKALHARRATRPAGTVVASLSGPEGRVREWPVSVS